MISRFNLYNGGSMKFVKIEGNWVWLKLFLSRRNIKRYYIRTLNSLMNIDLRTSGIYAATTDFYYTHVDILIPRIHMILINKR